MNPPPTKPAADLDAFIARWAEGDGGHRGRLARGLREGKRAARP
jgi:hypothetical protein